MRIKYVIRGFITILIISSLLTLTAYAEKYDWYQYPCVTSESLLLPAERKQSTVIVKPTKRGSIIAQATLSISNEGGGKIGIYAQTLAYVKIDKCRMRIYLDRWIEEEKRWAMVDNWDYTITEAQEPGQELSMATISFDVTNQPEGYYYRLRGLHAVWLNGQSEGFSTETDGVFITK